MSMTIYMKRFACHGAAQAQLQALQDIQAEHKFSPSDVDSIEVGGHHEMWDRHNIPEPQDPMIAQYSVNFAIALGMFHNPRDPRTFNENTIKDPQILAMCKKVKLYKEEGAGHMTNGRHRHDQA